MPKCLPKCLEKLILICYNSEKEEYQRIHNEIIAYLLFLQSQAELYPTPPDGMLRSWYCFSGRSVHTRCNLRQKAEVVETYSQSTENACVYKGF